MLETHRRRHGTALACPVGPFCRCDGRHIPAGCIADFHSRGSGLVGGLAAPQAPNVPPVRSLTQPSLGNDGPWSTFTIGIGTPPQTLNLLVATASSQTLVILQSGCPRNITNAYPQCATARGLLYNPTQSSSWHEQGLSAIIAQQKLGIYRDADFGNDTLNLGGSLGALQDQVIGGVNALEYWVGHFGVGVQSANALPGSNQLSALSTLHERAVIPSLSFGYTAGNPYR